jgi:hypothetical protein
MYAEYRRQLEIAERMGLRVLAVHEGHRGWFAALESANGQHVNETRHHSPVAALSAAIDQACERGLVEVVA